MKFWKPVLTRVALYGGAMLFMLRLTHDRFERAEIVACVAACVIVFAFEAVLQLTRNGDSK